MHAVLVVCALFIDFDGVHTRWVGCSELVGTAYTVRRQDSFRTMHEKSALVMGCSPTLECQILLSWSVYWVSGSITFCFSNSLLTTLTRPLMDFMTLPMSKVLVVPVQTSSPSGAVVA